MSAQGDFVIQEKTPDGHTIHRCSECDGRSGTFLVVTHRHDCPRKSAADNRTPSRLMEKIKTPWTDVVAGECSEKEKEVKIPKDG